MVQKYLRLFIAILILSFSTQQFINSEIGNGIFLILISLFPILFHFRNERILLALWQVRKQDFQKAGNQLDKINNPEKTLIKGQLAYYYFLR